MDLLKLQPLPPRSLSEALVRLQPRIVALVEATYHGSVANVLESATLPIGAVLKRRGLSVAELLQI